MQTRNKLETICIKVEGKRQGVSWMEYLLNLQLMKIEKKSVNGNFFGIAGENEDFKYS